MSLSESQIVSENGENKKILLLDDRNQRYCHEHSQKLHTNEKLHAKGALMVWKPFQTGSWNFSWNHMKYIFALQKVYPKSQNCFLLKICKKLFSMPSSFQKISLDKPYFFLPTYLFDILRKTFFLYFLVLWMIFWYAIYFFTIVYL